MGKSTIELVDAICKKPLAPMPPCSKRAHTEDGSRPKKRARLPSASQHQYQPSQPPQITQLSSFEKLPAVTLDQILVEVVEANVFQRKLAVNPKYTNNYRAGRAALDAAVSLRIAFGGCPPHAHTALQKAFSGYWTCCTATISCAPDLENTVIDNPEMISSQAGFDHTTKATFSVDTAEHKSLYVGLMQELDQDYFFGTKRRLLDVVITRIPRYTALSLTALIFDHFYELVYRPGRIHNILPVIEQRYKDARELAVMKLAKKMFTRIGAKWDRRLEVIVDIVSRAEPEAYGSFFVGRRRGLRE
ncbi:hypothetical protein LTR95_000611 [Oleoguttula sp. CCFEE 5521]